MNQLEELKRLLFSEEQESLHELAERVADRGVRAQDVADVLPDSIALHQADQVRLVESLRLPVGECIRQSVQHDTEMFADALAPVMGPAIRRAVADSFKTAMQRLNETLEQGLSLRGLKWRFESRRTGVPVSELILRDTLVYSIEQLFLIHRESGLLINHVAIDRPEVADSDAVSAMLTAIQSFVRDSFGDGEDDDDGNLDTIDIGDHVVWLFYGPEAMLACVIRGIAPLSKRSRYQSLLDEIHRRYPQELARFDGSRDALPAANVLMTEQLHIETEPGAAGGQRGKLLSPPLIALLLLLLAGAAALLFLHNQHARRLDTLSAALADAPGLLITAIERDNGVVTVSGLRDPLAEDPAPLASAAGFKAGDVEFTLRPFQSLEAPFVLGRARQLLAPPPGVSVALNEGVLSISGIADPAWIARTAALPLAAVGVAAVDRSGLATSAPTAAEILAAARAALAPPAGVELALYGERLMVSGTAPQAWVQGLRLPDDLPVRSLDTASLRTAERIELERLVDSLALSTIDFSAGTTLSDTGEAALRRLIARLQAATALAGDLGDTALAITIGGGADPTGPAAVNERLREARAELVMQALAAAGVPDATFSKSTAGSAADGERRAVVRVTLTDTAPNR